MTPFMFFVLSFLFYIAHSVVCTRQLGARCAYFPIIGAGRLSGKRPGLGPVCQTDLGQIKARSALLIIDFDIYKIPGQSHDKRCHWMIICAALIALARVLYVTALQPGTGPWRMALMPHLTALPSCDWR
jgi:hypothetical protein